MDWEQYNVNLTLKLESWFEGVVGIQNKKFSNEEVLFELNKNTLDAFSAMVDVYSSGISFEDWIENEKVRQRQKSLQGKIGDLHELMILALGDSIKKRDPSVVSGYDKPLRIFDLYDDESENKWIAEIKNKHNTTKGEDRKASFEKLEKGLEIVGEGYNAYYVTIIRKAHERVEQPFTPSDSTADRNKAHPNIIYLDGESFYTMVTEEEDALSRAFDVLKGILKRRFDINTVNEPLLDSLKQFTFFKVKININQADIAALTSLNGIGPKTAEKIIAYREQLDGFSSIDQLLNIPRLTLEILQPSIEFIEV